MPARWCSAVATTWRPTMSPPTSRSRRSWTATRCARCRRAAGSPCGWATSGRAWRASRARRSSAATARRSRRSEKTGSDPDFSAPVVLTASHTAGLVLLRLHIENLALIEHAELELDPGLNVLTGETGAGKTMLAHAIGLIAGVQPAAEMVG